MYQKRQLIRLETLLMIFLIEKVENNIKGKYIQLCLAHQFGWISTIEFTQTLAVSLKNDNQ